MPIPALPLFKHRDTVVTPADQNQFVTQFENTMDTMSNDVIPALNLSISDMNAQYNNIYNNLPFAPDSGYSQSYIDANIYKKTETYNKTEVDTAISDATYINTLLDKPTPDNTDNFAIQEVGGDLKKVSYENLTKLSPNDSRVKTSLNASGTAPIYACRAWVNFNGTGTVAIRASGNVSSITDNGVGNYTVNFTTAMTDSNYSVSGTSLLSVDFRGCVSPADFTISSFRVYTTGTTIGYVTSETKADHEIINLSIFG